MFYLPRDTRRHNRYARSAETLTPGGAPFDGMQSIPAVGWLNTCGVQPG